MALRRAFPCVLGLVALLSGCSSNLSPVLPNPSAAGLSGNVHGGQQPIVGATIQLYTVGTTGDGSPATPKLTATVTSGPDGGFSLAGLFSCTGTTQLYITATTGSPGPGITNPNLALMTALGPCGTPEQNAARFIQINEVTTVAAVAALAPYMTSLTSIGSGSGDAAALTNAFNLAAAFADSTTGTSPGPVVPAGTIVPTAEIDTLANILAACVNSAGGMAGQNNICGQLFTLTTPSGSTAPTDTVLALLDLANNPALNTSSLFALTLPNAPFQPTLAARPPDFHIALLPMTGTPALTISPSSLTFATTSVAFPSVHLPVVFSSNGTEAVTLTSLTFVGPNAADFQLQGLCPSGTDIPSGTTCTDYVTATPTGTGTRAATLVVSSNDPSSPQTVPVSVLGHALNAGPVYLSDPGYESGPSIAGTSRDFVLGNYGTTPVTIRSITSDWFTFVGDPCGIHASTPAILPAMSTCTITVQANTLNFNIYVSPVAFDSVTGTITVDDDAVNGPQTATVSLTNTLGYSGASIPNTSPSYYPDFGSQALQTTSTGTLNFTSPFFNHYSSTFGTVTEQMVAYPTISVSGTNAADFSVTAPPQNDCLDYANCTYNIAFSPTAVGVRKAQLLINGGPQYIPITGTGYVAGGFAVQTSGLPINTWFTFDNIALGNVQVTVTNTTSSAESVSFAISGPNAADFSITDNGCATLAAAANCVGSVRFYSTVVGPRSATLTITDSVTSTVKTVALSATSLYHGLRAVSPVAFPGFTAPGASSAPQSIQVTDDSYPNRQVLGHPVSASLPAGSNFSFPSGSTCPENMNDYCYISVAFSPHATGYLTDTMTLTDLTTGGTWPVTLYGTAGVAGVHLDKISISFPLRSAGSNSFPVQVTLTNNGTAPLDFTNISITGDPAGNFSLGAYNCPQEMTVGGSCFLSVTYNPQVTGPSTATLQILSSAPSSPDMVALSGTAD